MREMGLKGCVPRGFKPQTTVVDPQASPAPNRLKQEFHADRPDQKWATDITYLWTACGWVYLAVVLDLFSRKVTGWHVSNSPDTQLVQTALQRAVERRRPAGAELLHHSDRGCQYTSHDYQRTLAALNIQPSMSRTGCCYDNAVVERFFWSLKHEWIHRCELADLEHARQEVFRYIESFYNTTRLHQTLGYLSPDQFEAENAPAQAA